MKTGLARGLSLAAYLGLFAWVMLWIIVLGDVAREHVSMWLLFFAGPLLLPLRGVLRGNDKGESPLDGALIVGRHGRGHFVYTGLSFFRQLPAGVAGAYRLFANLLAL